MLLLWCLKRILVCVLCLFNSSTCYFTVYVCSLVMLIVC